MTDKTRPDRRRVTVPHDPTLMTKQAPASELSVEAQLRRYVNHGMLPSDGRRPTYGDFTNIGDFQDHLVRVRQAESDFMLLPAHVRRLCDNNPGKYVEAVHRGDRQVIDAMIAAGLMEVHVPETAEKASAIVSGETPGGASSES